MKILTYRWSYRIPDRHVIDVERMQNIARVNGYIISPGDASKVWHQHSDTLAAGWLIMDYYSDEDILRIMLDYTSAEDVENAFAD
jgi:hypothetical protein